MGLASYELRDALSTLEAAGGLLRRGRSLRITPDLLSDRVLAEACLDAQDHSTGYADAAFDWFFDLSLEPLLRNLSELDWKAGDGNEGFLLASIWDRLRERYDGAKGYARSSLVKAIAKAAYFQPRQSLDFVRHVWERLERVEQGEDEELLFFSSRGSVIRMLPDILEDAANYPETIRECLDLLWDMRPEAGQETKSNPNHPIRVLQRIAEIQPLQVKPAWVYEAVLDRIDVWLSRPDAFDYGFSPLDVIDHLLERRGSVTSSTGRAISWYDFQVTSIEHGPFRRQALKLLETVTALEDSRVQRRSLKSLVAVLWRPRELGIDTAALGSDELQSRQAENSEIVRIIDDLLEKADSPVLYAMAAHELSQVVFRANPDTQDDVQGLLARVPQDYSVRLTSRLWRGPMQRPIRLGGEEASEKQLDAELQGITRELLCLHTDPSAVHAEVERIFADLGRFGLAPDQTGSVLRAVAEEDPAFATRLAKWLITEQPESVLASFLSELLRPLRSGPSEEFHALIHLAASSPAVVPPRALAHFLSTGSRPSDEERRVIWQIAYHPDPVVRRFVLEALGRFPSAADAEWEVLSRIDIAADPDLADRLCGCLVADEEAELRKAPEGVIQAVLAKLRDVPDLSHGKAERTHLGQLHRFLDRLAVHDPECVAAFFLARLERHRARRGSNDRYDPVPFAQFSSFSTGEADASARRRALQRVRDAAITSEALDSYWLAHVFVALSGGFDEVSLGVLNDWVESGDTEKLTAAVGLLQPVDGSFVFDQEDFVVGLLRQADRLGADLLQQIRETLGGLAPGNLGGSGTPGEPMPFKVEVHERAMAARARYPAGSVPEAFYGDLERRAAEWLEADQVDWEETMG